MTLRAKSCIGVTPVTLVQRQVILPQHALLHTCLQAASEKIERYTAVSVEHKNLCDFWGTRCGLVRLKLPP